MKRCLRLREGERGIIRYQEHKARQDFSDINRLVETSVATLCAHGSRNDCQINSLTVSRSSEPPLSRVQGMSDLEAIKQVPHILCSLNKRALKTLFFALNGRQLTTNHRYILEREIKKAFTKIESPPGGGPPETLRKMASVIRSPSSYRHTLGSANPSVNFIPTMPSCTVAAAHKAFACVKDLPTCIVVEVGKLLTMESDPISPVSFRYKTHSRTVGAVYKEVEKVMNQLTEDDMLPASLEKALHAISLSARLLLGNDGGLAGLLKPLPAEKLALEREFSAAYNQIKNLDDVNLSRVSNLLGKRAALPSFRKQQRVDELQQHLIESMHCIYAFSSFPQHVKEAMQMISSTTDEAKMNCNNDSIKIQETNGIYSPSKNGKIVQRLSAEIDAALTVSAALQNVVWELYNSFSGHGLEMAGEQTFLRASYDTQAAPSKCNSAEAKTNPLLSSPIPDLEGSSAEKNEYAVKKEMEVIEDEGPDKAADECMASRKVQQDTDQYALSVESFSDEAALMIYVMVGCLLKETAMQHFHFMDHTKLAYFQTGLDRLQHFSALTSIPCSHTHPGCSDNLNADELVLYVAKQLKSIPKSVISEVELRMGQQRH
ncbi:hypothetical protein L7F22_038010 [Adiantum nelumboides]|nr:hypothetical protein [Adiantum nelumboides]